MNKLNIYLAASLAVVTTYTLIVGSMHGWNLLPLFFAAITDTTWQGQFNVDFTSFLALSGLWVAWRHDFSPKGLTLGLIALFGGMIFLASYLIWANKQGQGRVERLLLGELRFQRLIESQ